eukprot:1681876-Lingulodinium_polyedra.AAC.1
MAQAMSIPPPSPPAPPSHASQFNDSCCVRSSSMTHVARISGRCRMSHASQLNDSCVHLSSMDRVQTK